MYWLALDTEKPIYAVHSLLNNNVHFSRQTLSVNLCAVFIKQRENLITLVMYLNSYIYFPLSIYGRWIRSMLWSWGYKESTGCSYSTYQRKTSEELSFFIRQSSADSGCAVWICLSMLFDSSNFRPCLFLMYFFLQCSLLS